MNDKEIETLKEMVKWIDKSISETPDLPNNHYTKLRNEFILEIEHLEQMSDAKQKRL